MGVIDKKTYSLSCARCGTEESGSIVDSGSSWGSSWEAGAKFQKFDSEWRGGGQQEPTLNTATCKTCGGPATVNSHYST